MLKIITSLTILLFGMLAKAQVTENREASDFSKVEVQNGIELIYTENSSTSLQIEANDERTLNNIVTEIKGKTLKIYLEDTKNNQTNAPMKVYLSAHDLVALEASSGSKITITDQLTAQHLNLTLNSGATFTGNIITKEKTKLTTKEYTVFNGRIETVTFAGNFKSNSKVNLTGLAKQASIQTKDVALLSAKNFVAKAIKLNAEGKSSAMIHADNTIDLTVNDKAKVSYTGLPKKVKWNEEAEAFHKYNCNQSLSFN